MQSSIPVF